MTQRRVKIKFLKYGCFYYSITSLKSVIKISRLFQKTEKESLDNYYMNEYPLCYAIIIQTVCAEQINLYDKATSIYTKPIQKLKGIIFGSLKSSKLVY